MSSGCRGVHSAALGEEETAPSLCIHLYGGVKGGEMPKRLVMCCDGTWSTADQLRDGEPAPTNVTKVALAVAPKDSDGREQRTFYQQGVGTTRRERIRGGA